MVEQPSESQDITWETIKEETAAEIDKVRQELREITMMLDQSQVEVNRLTQRNASVTARLQQIFGHFESVPREDIREAYDEALDAQQRLFVMRGQLEKLQGDKERLKTYLNYMEKIYKMLEGEVPEEKEMIKKGTFDVVEAIIQAQESERQRLSRQMHDGPAQALSNFILQTEIAMRLFDMDADKAREELNNLKNAATLTFQQVRDFIFELRPMMLDDLGLVPTLKRYVQAVEGQYHIPVSFNFTGMEKRLEDYIEVIVFRAIQELLGNAARHSKGDQIKVQVDITESHVRTVVEDNGQGFDPEEALQSGMGLKIIKERVEMIGGYIDIDAEIGRGSRITFQVPVSMNRPEM